MLTWREKSGKKSKYFIINDQTAEQNLTATIFQKIILKEETNI